MPVSKMEQSSVKFGGWFPSFYPFPLLNAKHIAAGYKGRHPRGGGGGLPYESDGDARRKIIINTLKETNLGVAPALFNP